MDVLTPQEQEAKVSSSALAREYNEEIDRESAYEILNRKLAPQPVAEQDQETRREPQETDDRARDISKTIKTIANSSVTKTIVREVTRGLLGVLIGKPARSSSRRRY